jgi:hypothetical protein
MNKYEKNKPVKKYDQITLDEAIEEVAPKATIFKACPDCHAGTNALGKPLDCRSCNSTGKA